MGRVLCSLTPHRRGASPYDLMLATPVSGRGRPGPDVIAVERLFSRGPDVRTLEEGAGRHETGDVGLTATFDIGLIRQQMGLIRADAGRRVLERDNPLVPSAAHSGFRVSAQGPRRAPRRKVGMEGKLSPTRLRRSTRRGSRHGKCSGRASPGRTSSGQVWRQSKVQ
jgi:hypothetical protein